MEMSTVFAKKTKNFQKYFSESTNGVPPFWKAHRGIAVLGFKKPYLPKLKSVKLRWASSAYISLAAEEDQKNGNNQNPNAVVVKEIAKAVVVHKISSLRPRFGRFLL